MQSVSLVALLSTSDRFGAFDALADAGPGVHPLTMPDGGRAWLVTGYDEVRRGLADPRFSLNRANATSWSGLGLPGALDVHLLNVDPPQHTRLRRLAAAAFQPAQVERLLPAISRAAGHLLDGWTDGTTVDLVGDYAAPLTIGVLADLLGVPAADQRRFRELVAHMLACESRGDRAGLAATVREVDLAVRALVAHRRGHPGDDLITSLVHAHDADDRLSEDELRSMAFLILLAGTENTVHLIGNAALLLLERPQVRSALVADPDRAAAWVEEVLRVAPPAPLAIRRFPRADVTLAGVVIPAGDAVLFGIAAANRDAVRYPRAAEPCPGRTGPPQLGFGHGPHYCLGAGLARAQARVALTALLSRFPTLTSPDAEGPRWLASVRTNGLARLPVTLGSPPAPTRAGAPDS
ncbi:cytochrome P450 hydroxylase [Pilimelia terevasa]|uniref:Cytochrome P450 hydroxylase n=1 Tax=Pilimelia terevasa TaxID=53372 RepID=A0A8J3BU29_9ACTN|nr:cytochrome P450 [Pilimelia terevasa]GGK41789.1 cytochrome P450 hydroxylase [Pilimelia terevasa]